ncbi:MAG: hypothetical protein WBG19_05280 [Thermoplasmata archaeon]
MPENLPRFAFYYPGPIWADAGWIKNLILYFDGVALLVPSYLRTKPFDVGGTTAAELQQAGLLKILEPESFIDKKSVKELSQSLSAILESGKLDKLSTEHTVFAELSYSRLGSAADERLAEEVYRELSKRGLAKESEDGVSIPMHPSVRALILVLWSQILRPIGRKHGLDLQPATDRPQMNQALEELLGLRAVPSPSDVISCDTISAGVDLANAPISKVLAFREKHHEEFGEYARDLHRFVHDMSCLATEPRAEAFADRQEEIKEAAGKLRSMSRRAWAGRAAFGLGILGAAWNIKRGDVIGGALSAGAGLTGAAATRPSEASAYSYLFRASKSLN